MPGECGNVWGKNMLEEELTSQIISDVFKEIKAAQEKHGPLPDDLVHCAAIIAEEAGEICQAVLQHEYEGGFINVKPHKKIYNEACQTAAMAVSLMLKIRMENK